MKITFLEPVLPGLIVSFLAVLFGTGAGMVFGITEKNIESSFINTTKAHPKILGKNLSAVAKPSKDSWRYLQRSRFHAQDLGALGIGIILVLALTRASQKAKTFLSLGIGLGAFLYSLCRLISDLRIPFMGKYPVTAGVDWLAGISIPLFFGSLSGVLLILLMSWMTAISEKLAH